MRNLLSSRLFGMIYGFLLVAFTLYLLLDVFVIAHRYDQVEPIEKIGQARQSQQDANNSEQQSSSSTLNDDSGKIHQPTDQDDLTKLSNDTEYADENIAISITTFREHDTDIYVADVMLSSADYLKTALAENSYGRNIKQATSAIAAQNQAILAINGDFYGAQSQGYVIRNGTLYRSSKDEANEDLVIYGDGSFGIIQESEISAEELWESGAQQVLAFGPALIEDRSISVTARDEVGKAMVSNPRTAIGIIDDLHYVFVVSDGRTSASKGLSLYELAQFMQALGVETAYNLDGGGSSTLYFNGKVINNPTTNGKSIKERSVSDIVYIGY